MDSRRIIALLLSVIITVLSFTGCSLSEVAAPQNGNKPHDVNVTFDFNYDGCPEQVQIVAASGKANEELVPEREGFTFTGWFLDKRARTPYDFESILTDDITLYAGWQELYDEDDIIPDFVDTTAFESFFASTSDVMINESFSVTFFAEVASQDFIEGEEIAVYNGENKVCVLNDKGADGDLNAEDGIFSGTAILYSDERKLELYHAEFDNMVSDTFEICFYTPISDEEFETAMDLSTTVYDFDNSNDVVNYITSNENVVNHKVSQDGSSVSFTTDSGITCVWEEPTEDGTKARSNDLSRSSGGMTYRQVESKLDDVTLNPSHEETDVCVIKPYRSTDFPYDDFETVGELVASELSGNLTVLEDEYASRALLKNFSDFGVVLWDSHGVLAYDDPYLLTGETMSSWTNSADWNASRIVLCGNRVAVGSKFFDTYYEENSLNNTMFFLGTCYSLYDNTISDALIKKGASVVFGFSNISSVSYNNDTLFELVLNQLLLEGKTAKEAYEKTLEICGETDCDVDGTKLYMRGSERYTLVGDTGYVSGRVQSINTGEAIGNAFVRFTNRLSGETTTFRTRYNGSFNARLPVGMYDVRVSAYSYLDELTNSIEVDAGITNHLENSILLHPADYTVISGNIINALTGDAIPEARIRFRRNLGNTTGEYLTYVNGAIVEIAPDSSGNYLFESLPAGYYTAEVFAENFITTYRNIVASADSEYIQDVALSPTLSTEEIRIILTWGLNPLDLDSHLEGPGNIHTWYNDLTASVNGEPVADLDLDDTDSYGPETTTIRKIQPGVYYFYVHNYSTAPEITHSGAQVKVYQGSSLIASYNVPSNVPDELYWNVFKYDSTTGTITPNNTITSSPLTNY